MYTSSYILSNLCTNVIFVLCAECDILNDASFSSDTCIKIKREVVPQYLATSIPILAHSYNTRRTTDQQYRTHHAFADRNCLHAMIDLMDQSPEIKMHVATCTSLAPFISIVKQNYFA